MHRFDADSLENYSFESLVFHIFNMSFLLIANRVLIFERITIPSVSPVS